jgi:hypothetical protein
MLGRKVTVDVGEVPLCDGRVIEQASFYRVEKRLHASEVIAHNLELSTTKYSEFPMPFAQCSFH